MRKLIALLLAVILVCVFSGTVFAISGYHNGHMYMLTPGGSSTKLYAMFMYGTEAFLSFKLSPTFSYVNMDGTTTTASGTIATPSSDSNSLIANYSLARAAAALNLDKLPNTAVFTRCIYRGLINDVVVGIQTETY